MKQSTSFVDLRELQGTMEWAIRGLYQSTMGWFDGLAESLFPLTPTEQALRWLNLIPAKRLLKSAKEAITSGIPFQPFLFSMELKSYQCCR